MRVTRTQARENRQTVINVAARLFREHGFDGIGLKDVMEAAGLTQGAFYKQFASKGDLAAQASERALETAAQRWAAAAEASPKDPLAAVISFYLSTGHRDETGDGCPIVALGADAARQSVDVKASFEAGIKKYIEMLSGWAGDANRDGSKGKAMAIISTMVGAVVLSRAVNDERLSRQILKAAADTVLKTASTGDRNKASLE
jgi:TetR/AcrR family transcriptional repressor of nem operon